MLKPFSSGLFRASAVAFFVRGLGAVSAFFMSLAVARVLPADESGLFFLAVAVVSVLAPAGVLGAEVASLRFIGAWVAEADWARTRALARVTWRWAGITLFTCSMLMALSAPWLAEHVFNKPAFGPILRTMAPGLLLIGGGILLSSQLQALRLVPQSIFVLSIGVPLGVALCAWVLPVYSAMAVGGLYVSAGAVTLALGLFWWYRSVPKAPIVVVDKSELWASCLPLWVTTMMSVLALWSSQFIAGVWVSAEEVAQLAVAQRTANLVSFILVAVNLVVAPRFAALYKQGKHEELRRLALRSVRLMSLVGGPVVLFLCLFPAWVMSFFGPEYRAAAPLMVILALGQFVNVITGSVGFLLTMSGHERDMRNVVLFSGPFAVLAALVLTPWYGVTGAALATALAVSVQNLGAVWLVRKRLGFNTLAVWERV